MKVIFVCTANVCRSPLAEGYLKSLLAGTSQEFQAVEKSVREKLDISSAGLAALAGSPPFDCAVEVAKQFQFDISKKRAQQLTTTMVQSADRILCMETWQASTVMKMDPSNSRNVSLLGAFHPLERPLLQILDPEDFSTPEMFVTFEVIRSAIEGFLSSLATKLTE
jgi:protein-tyrosine phosphatase